MSGGLRSGNLDQKCPEKFLGAARGGPGVIVPVEEGIFELPEVGRLEEWTLPENGRIPVEVRTEKGRTLEKIRRGGGTRTHKKRSPKAPGEFPQG